MFKKTSFPIFLMFLFALCFTCKLRPNEILTKQTQEKIHTIASSIVSKMSDEQKAGQVIHLAIPSKELDEVALSELKKIMPGGIILFGVNLGTKSEIKKLTSSLQMEIKNLGLPPLFISTDQEGGRVIRVQKSVTEFPGAMAIGQTKNEVYAEKVGFITSYELNALGINLLFAPCLDINNNPENPVINTRSFGSDVETVTQMGVAYELGARKGGALPVIKHFPGHGDTNVDSHLGLPVIQKDLQELEKFELVPFQKAIELGARAVMSAHIVYPKIDPLYPATLSSNVLNGILRNKLKFSGLVFTDAMEMDAISKNYKKEKRATLAILAGADVILLTSYGKNTKEYYDMILESIQNKEFIVGEKNLLDEALIRQISLKIEQGLFEDIEDEKIVSYLKERNQLAKVRYEELEKEGIKELNQKISKEAIRAWKKEFKPLSLEEAKEYTFFITNKKLKKEFSLLGIKTFSEKKFQKLIKRKKTGKFIFDIHEQKDIKKIYKWLKPSSKSKIILLNYGSPFLDYPKIENLSVIFSFSPTKASLRALVERVFLEEEMILPANLNFKSN